MNKGVKAVYHASLLEAMREEEGRRAGKLVHIPALEGVIRPLQVGNECKCFVLSPYHLHLAQHAGQLDHGGGGAGGGLFPP